MCGITGIYRFKGKVDEKVLLKLSNAVRHRGPDHGSFKIFNNVGLAHRRLSIIDLSNHANQPMSCCDNRYNIVYNGEVYNFLEIKKTLIKNGIKFNTNSDTEVILKSFVFYGYKAFSLFNGMFALGIYDSLKNELILARDQYGIKPLYIYHDQNLLIFSSEKKSILKFNEIRIDINYQAMSEYIWFGNPLGNNTFYNQINELEPGTIIKISKGKTEKNKFFDINNIKETQISEDDAVGRIKHLFKKSIKRHLISDVPVGIFLSGGIDSSAITAYASKISNKKLKTFSVGFDYNKGINELSLAAKIANKFGTEHNEIHIKGNNLIDTIESLVIAHDEPFGDAADIPLFLLSKKIKGNVKVVLQGDGGDEFFGGYSRYWTINKRKYLKLLSFLPNIIELSRTNNTKLLRFQRFINAVNQKKPYLRNALLLTMESKYTNPTQVFNYSFKQKILNCNPFERYEEVYSNYRKNLDQTQSLFYTDTQIILKDTFFEKVDKSTMANSLEVRVPFIDKDLTEFALSLPSKLKTKNGVQKYLLKKAMHDIIPHEILYGKKKGFSVPYDFWLRTSLKDYFKFQISTKKANKFIDSSHIKNIFNLHEKEKGNYGFLLWKTLIFCIWINSNKNI